MDERRVPCLNPRPAPAAWTRTEWPRMTVDTLKDCNKKVLAQMAKDQGIAGWHAMRKDQLIRALSLPPSASKKGMDKVGASEKRPTPIKEKDPAPARRGGSPPSLPL